MRMHTYVSARRPCACVPQIHGCENSLANAPRNCRRVRVCPLHIRAPYLDLDGGRKRFCHQCGRFQELGLFDGELRSCR